MADRQLVRDAHAAVHLHRALPAELARLADLDLGTRGGLGAHRRILVIDLERGHQRHRTRFLRVGEAVDHAVLQHLELADRHAELLAGLDVVERRGVDRVHAAGGLGAQRHDGTVDRLFHGREGVVDLAQHGVGADRDLVEGQFGSAQRILRRVIATAEALGLGVDDEQRQALGLARRTGGTGQHDDVVGGSGIVDYALVARERPAVAFLGRLERHVGQVVAALALQPGEGELLLALDHRRQQRLLLGRRTGAGDHAAAQHHRRQERLEDQALTELLHDDHGLDRAAAVAAILLGEGHAEPAQLGELRPVLRQPAALGRRDLAAIVERVLLAREALGRFLQLLLFVGKGQIHVSPPEFLDAVIAFVRGQAPSSRRCSSESRCCRRRCWSCAC